MTIEVIEGEAVEVDAPRAVAVVQQPGQSLVADSGKTGPADMIEKASAIATALRDIVERQKLYAVIQGKKYPQVEAWSTIARMDNVVAREVVGGVFRHDDGSYEAHVELVRLSDVSVIGRASALCGMPDDKPWATRAEYARRSMAVTRATSRAFRQHYSWIMALAGYEPTPADEMPGRDEAPEAEPERDHERDGFIGTVAKGKNPVDMELRQTPDGSAWGFKLTEGRKGYQALAVGPLADALSVAGVTVGSTVTVWGPVQMVDWQKDGKDMPPYARILIEKIHTPEYVLPAPPSDPAPGVETPEPVAPGQETAFDLSEAALS